jgi:hypothetical protein
MMQIDVQQGGCNSLHSFDTNNIRNVDFSSSRFKLAGWSSRGFDSSPMHYMELSLFPRQRFGIVVRLRTWMDATSSLRIFMCGQSVRRINTSASDIAITRARAT